MAKTPGGRWRRAGPPPTTRSGGSWAPTLPQAPLPGCGADTSQGAVGWFACGRKGPGSLRMRNRGAGSGWRFLPLRPAGPVGGANGMTGAEPHRRGGSPLACPPLPAFPTFPIHRDARPQRGTHPGGLEARDRGGMQGTVPIGPGGRPWGTEGGASARGLPGAGGHVRSLPTILGPGHPDTSRCTGDVPGPQLNRTLTTPPARDRGGTAGPLGRSGGVRRCCWDGWRRWRRGTPSSSGPPRSTDLPLRLPPLLRLYAAGGGALRFVALLPADPSVFHGALPGDRPCPHPPGPHPFPEHLRAGPGAGGMDGAHRNGTSPSLRPSPRGGVASVEELEALRGSLRRDGDRAPVRPPAGRWSRPPQELDRDGPEGSPRTEKPPQLPCGWRRWLWPDGRTRPSPLRARSSWTRSSASTRWPGPSPSSAGCPRVPVSEIDLEELLAGIVARHRRPDLPVELDVEPATPRIHGASSRLGRVFGNLVVNAVEGGGDTGPLGERRGAAPRAAPSPGSGSAPPPRDQGAHRDGWRITGRGSALRTWR